MGAYRRKGSAAAGEGAAVDVGYAGPEDGMNPFGQSMIPKPIVSRIHPARVG